MASWTVPGVGLHAVSALEWRAEVLVTFSQGSHASTLFFDDPCANVGEVVVGLSSSGVYRAVGVVATWRVDVGTWESGWLWVAVFGGIISGSTRRQW
jgi:hypothetical protein